MTVNTEGHWFKANRGSLETVFIVCWWDTYNTSLRGPAWRGFNGDQTIV